MKTLFCLLLLSANAHALESLPAAPTPVAVTQPVFHAMDWTLAGALYTSHAADYMSTEKCVHDPVRCDEKVLPQALVHRNGAFGVYEFATASLEVYGAYRLAKMGHPRLARIAQSINVGLTTRTVADNYVLAFHTPRQTGLVPFRR